MLIYGQSLFTAVKCNDDAVVVKELAKLGTGFDCASKNEIKLVCKYICISKV